MKRKVGALVLAAAALATRQRKSIRKSTKWIRTEGAHRRHLDLPGPPRNAKLHIHCLSVVHCRRGHSRHRDGRSDATSSHLTALRHLETHRRATVTQPRSVSSSSTQQATPSPCFKTTRRFHLNHDDEIVGTGEAYVCEPNGDNCVNINSPITFTGKRMNAQHP